MFKRKSAIKPYGRDWHGDRSTISLLALYHFSLISNDTFIAGWLARYAVLFGGLTIAGIGSLITWLRKTPARERGPAVRQAIKRVPVFLAWFIPLMAVMWGLDWLEKHRGVPFLLSGAVLLALYLAVLWG